MTNTYCVYTVLRYSLWCVVDLSETCRVLYQRNLRNSASVGSYNNLRTALAFIGTYHILEVSLLYCINCVFLLLHFGDWVLFVLLVIFSLAVVKYIMFVGELCGLYLLATFLQYSLSICNLLGMPWITYFTVRHAQLHLVHDSALTL